MVREWQQWLSPRPPWRTETPVEPRLLAPFDAALFEFLDLEDGRMVVKETHYADNKFVRDGRSGPMLHIHLSQDEYFEVMQGTLAVVKNEKNHVVTKDDGVLEIPAGTRHRFWAHSPLKEDLIFHVWAIPNDLERGFNENCLRNYLGYLKDCEKHKTAPSIFQMALFGWACDTVMITPPFWVPIWMLKSFQYAAGHFIGKHLLGYQPTYAEYNTKPRPGGAGGGVAVQS